MACRACLGRAALLAALAPALDRTTLTRQSLLGLLALSDTELCHALKVRNADAPWRQTAIARDIPYRPSRPDAAAICRHDAHDQHGRGDCIYPLALEQLDCAPAVLFTSASVERLRELLHAPTVAIVGERHHSDYAGRVTLSLARGLAAAGVTLVSGLHKGLDGIAQRSALQAGGRSIAVTGCAPEHPYPPTLASLHRHITARGAVMSEFPPGFHPPRRWCFIASHRIIAALADVVVIVEAEKRSIALFTAQIASDLGAEIAAAPSGINDPGGAGTFKLLRDGAHPIGCARDVLEVVGEVVR